MLKLEGLVGVLTIALWIFCLIDVISADEGRIRHLPKMPWLLIVLFFPLVGSIIWLVAGRPEGGGRRVSAYEREAPDYPEYDRPGRAAAVDQDKDDAFLREVRARAEEQRARYRAQQRRDQERDRQRERGDEPEPS